MYNAHIYLKDCEKWLYPLIQAASWTEAQLIAEAIALCHGASIESPQKAVYALQLQA
ncbi:hypothetical protein H6F86_21070 [Phormidium sp. FACHB-592]|uniref:Uncharacterized protein n=1 Tax=Stenomitos frigidus AS-A4 TaxID=2933935 RepID=A0ABV0KEQ7_9CYAN|nr:hypothetical protein [Phormidium sp. FACHB-592]MBD2076327.1 hypothetical protein [Phormidium sp. FACHB-592]